MPQRTTEDGGDPRVGLRSGFPLVLCVYVSRETVAFSQPRITPSTIPPATKEVAGTSPSPLEQLLAERVALCWLQASYYDSLIAQTREYTPAKARILQKQHDAAQRNYLAAVKTLATVRKLLTPPRSPVEIASKLAGERSGLRLREAPVEAGVPVMN